MPEKYAETPDRLWRLHRHGMAARRPCHPGEKPEFLGGRSCQPRRRRVDLGAGRQHPHAERAGRPARHRDLRAVLARRRTEEGLQPHRPSRPVDPRGSSADQSRAWRAGQEGSAAGPRHGDRQAGCRRHGNLRPTAKSQTPTSRRARSITTPTICSGPTIRKRPSRCWRTPAPRT